jgi:ankyrin repeat protein
MNGWTALLVKNSNMWIKDKWKKTAFDYAKIYEHREVMALLEANASHEFGRTMLHEAVINEDNILVKHLLTAGVDIDARDHEGETPLMMARNQACVEILRSNGVDLEARDDEGFTALHRAAIAGRAEVVEALIEAGAEIDGRIGVGSSESSRERRGVSQPAYEGGTALHISAIYGEVAVVIALLDAGANSNTTTRSGRMAIHCTRQEIEKLESACRQTGPIEAFYLKSRIELLTQVEMLLKK